jgi:hypothetical protein
MRSIPLLSTMSFSDTDTPASSQSLYGEQHSRYVFPFFSFVGWGETIIYEWDWVHLVRRPLVGLLYQSRMIDEYGAFGGMRIGRGSRSTLRKPAPLSLCLPQIPHVLTSHWTRAAAVGSRWLTYGTAFHGMLPSVRSFYVLQETSSELAQAATLLIRIHVVSGSNLGRNTD